MSAQAERRVDEQAAATDGEPLRRFAQQNRDVLGIQALTASDPALGQGAKVVVARCLPQDLRRPAEVDELGP